MKKENNFLFNLVENVINIFNKLFNLSFILAVLVSVAEIQHNKKLYALAIIIYVLITFYIVYSSYCLYKIKENKLSIKSFITNLRDHSSDFLGFILCTFLSVFLLSLTFSATAIFNMLSLNL